MPSSAAMATATSTPSIKKASLLGLPAEIRLLILEEVFPPELIKNKFPQFLISGRVFDITHRASQPRPRPPPKTLSILLTSRALYHEGIETLYATCNVQVDVTITASPSAIFSGQDPVRIARIDDVRFWRHVRNLRLTVQLRKTGDFMTGLSIRTLAEQLCGGSKLRRLHVRFDWEDGEGWPMEAFGEAVAMVGRCFDLSGRGGKRGGGVRAEVLVEVAGEMDGEERVGIEERLRGRIVRGEGGEEGDGMW